MRRSLMDAIKNAYFYRLKKLIIGFFDESHDCKSGMIRNFSQNKEADFMPHRTSLTKKPKIFGYIPTNI